MKHPFFLLLAFFQTALFSQEFFQLDLASAPQDGVYVGGYFSGGLILPDSTVLGVPLDNQIQNYFITRYNDSGTLDWVRVLPVDTLGSTRTLFTRTKLESTPIGDVLISGSYSRFVGFDDSTSFTQSIYQRSGFLAKYDSLGNLAWSLNAWGDHEVHINTFTCDEEGNLYVAGQVRGTGNLNVGDFPSLYVSGSGFDTWLGKVSPNGSVEWLILYNGSGFLPWASYDIEVDASGAIYLLTDSRSVMKMDSSQNLWLKTIENGSINDIEPLDSGGLVLVGEVNPITSSNATTWDNATIASGSFPNSFVMEVDGNGDFERIYSPSKDTINYPNRYSFSYANRVERIDSTSLLISGLGFNVFFPPYGSGTSNGGYSVWLDSSFSMNCTNFISFFQSDGLGYSGFEHYEIQPSGSKSYFELSEAGGPASDLDRQFAYLNRVDDTCGIVWNRIFFNTRRVLSIADEAISFVSLVPNPARDGFEIVFEAPRPGKYVVTLMDLHGKVITQIAALGHEFPLTMNLPDLSSGMYLVLIEGERFQTREKLMVR